MPSRHIIKEMAADSYYHVYNRGVNKLPVFNDRQDYLFFLSLLKRHLSRQPQSDKQGREYKHLANDISLLSFCLMPNHFHLFVFNKQHQGLELLMRSLATSYSIYFNKRHHRVGPLFQGRYKASRIDDDAYLAHISRYIHRNPKEYAEYNYSSYRALVNNWDVSWLDKELFWGSFDGNVAEYITFTADYEDLKSSMSIIKHQLANR